MSEKSMNYIIFLIIIVLFHPFKVYSIPKIIDSSYEIKETNILGRNDKYAIFEAKYSDDLYYMNQWPCPCYEPNECSIKEPDEEFDDGDFDNIEIIEENVWKDVEISEGDEFPIFKFEFKKNEDEFECPLLFVEFDKGIGTVSLLISYNRIPNALDKDWFIPYFSKIGYSLCPGHRNFKYGNYYLSFINQMAFVKYHQFRIRIRRISSQICPINDDVLDEDWLQNGVKKEFELEELQEKKLYFKALLNENKCTNFSISANSDSPNDDVDIRLETDKAIYKAEQDGNAALNFIYCDEDNEEDFTIFTITIIEAYGNGKITVVATTEQYFPLDTMISDVLYSQFVHSNSFGNFPSIVCGDEEVFHCQFTTYYGCSDDQYLCCSKFFIITPTSNLNPLIPWNEDDEFYPTLSSIPLNVTRYITKKTISWGLLIESDNKKILSSDISKCIINHRSGTIVNKNYEVLEQKITFKPKKRTCSGKDAFKKVSNQVTNTILSMLKTHDYLSLTKHHIKLNELMFSNDILGCVDYINNFIEYNESSSYNNQFKSNFGYILNDNYTLDVDLVEEECHSKQCSVNVLESYVENEQFIDDPLKGCSKNFKQQSDFNNIQTQFVDTCWNDTMTSICINEQNREVLCNSENDFINCLVQEVNQTIAKIIFDHVWNYKGNYSIELFEDELKRRYIIEQCNGPDSIIYRDHYWYRPFIGICEGDECIDPRCFDPSCVIPKSCEVNYGAFHCYRYWYFSEKSDKEECEREKVCNWDSNIDDENECGEGFVCIDCDSNCNDINDETTCITNNGKWIKKEFYSKRTYGKSFDVISFILDVKSASDFLYSHSFSTEGSCRYTTSLSLIESFLCDCFDSNNSVSDNKSPCFDPTIEQHIASGFSCDSLESSFSFDHISLKIKERTFIRNNSDHSSCHSIMLYKIPAYAYQIDPTRSVSTSIFQNLETNEYWVVQNNKSVVIGQILSNGYRIQFENKLYQPIDLCINITIESISPIGKIYSFAYLDDENNIVAYDNNNNLFYYDEDNNRVCGKIWNENIYFAILAVENYPNENSFSRSMIIQNRIGATIYLIVIILSILQFIRIMILYKGSGNYKSKLVFIFFVFLNSLVRSIYLFISSNELDSSTLAAFKFFIFEFPSILFFSVFLAIIYLWMKIVNQLRFMTNRSKLKKTNTQLRIILFIITGIIYAAFLIFIILIAVSPSLSGKLPCYMGYQSGSGIMSYRITIAYWIFLSILSFILSVGVMIGFILLLKPILKTSNQINSTADAHINSKLIIISIIALLCVISMLIRSALFLYSSITRKSISAIGLALLEAIPSVGLLYYLSPIKKWKDITTRSGSDITGSTELDQF